MTTGTNGQAESETPYSLSLKTLDAAYELVNAADAVGNAKTKEELSSARVKYISSVRNLFQLANGVTELVYMRPSGDDEYKDNAVPFNPAMNDMGKYFEDQWEYFSKPEEITDLTNKEIVNFIKHKK